jgi:2C-methyl-D-erythritol 2,4-cyclodiphosphate synthase
MTDKLVTHKDVHDVIFLALMDLKNGGPIETDIDKAHRIGDAAFHALKEKGLLQERWPD